MQSGGQLVCLKIVQLVGNAFDTFLNRTFYQKYIKVICKVYMLHVIHVTYKLYVTGITRGQRLTSTESTQPVINRCCNPADKTPRE